MDRVIMAFEELCQSALVTQMMKLRKMAPLVFLILLFNNQSVLADADKEYYWWDGDQRRVLHLEENVLVEIPATSAAPKGVSAKAISSSQRLTEKLKSLPSVFKIEKIQSATEGFTKIYVKSSQFSEDIKNDLTGFSPLFRDGASAKAFAGGVIFTFRHQKSDEEAKAWVDSHHLRLKEKMGLLNGRTWLIESAANLQSLELANQLHDDPDVEFAQPNWAHEHSFRHDVYVIPPKKVTTQVKPKTSGKNPKTNSVSDTSAKAKLSIEDLKPNSGN